MKRLSFYLGFFRILFVTVLLSVSVESSYASGTSNYVTTRAVIAPTYGAYPAKGELRTDPVTGAGITRIADHSELTGNYNGSAPGMSIIVYSRYTPVNTTNEFVLIHGEDSTSCWVYRLSDNTMRAVLRMRPSLGTESRVLGEVNELRWDYSGAHPYRLYFVGNNISSSQAVGSENPGMSFYYTEIDPVTGEQSTPVLIRDFSTEFPSAGIYPTGGYVDNYLSNDVEGDSSNDSRYWAWMVMDPNSGGAYAPRAIFTYDKTANTILGRVQRNCTGVADLCTVIDTPATTSPYMSKPNMVEISPLGTRVVVDWGRTYPGNRDSDTGTVADGPHAFLKDFSDPIRIGADETHSGWAWGPNGEEMFISQNNVNDYIEAVDIATSTTANCTVTENNTNKYTCGTKVIEYVDLDMNNWTLGMHFGKVYDRTKRGWLFMNTYDKGYTTWGKNQNLFVEIKPYDAIPAPKLWRVNPSYNDWEDYRSEGSGALNFDATALYATANWGYLDGRAEAYKVGLPDNWYEYFNGPDITSPTTTASPAAGAYIGIKTVTLSCSDNVACTSIQFCTGAGCTPAINYTLPISIVTDTILRYQSNDAANNLEPIKESVYTITPDTTAPVITMFTIPATSSSLTVPISTFTATDAAGVTGWQVTESATPPTSTGWTAISSTTSFSSTSLTYTATSSGSKTLYAWVKDATGNVSSVYIGRTCTIALASTYYMTRDTTTNLAADGTCNVTGTTGYTSTTQPGKTTTRSTELGSLSWYYPTVTSGTTATALNVYTPAFTANAVDISAISASAALLGLAATDTVKLDLYDYDPAGVANNGVLVASSAAKTLTTTVTKYTWAANDFTINGTGRVAQNHRLQFRFTWYAATAGTPRGVHFGVVGATKSTNFTVTETVVETIPTLQDYYDTVPDGSSILLNDGLLVGPFTANRFITVSIKGGYNQTVTANSGYTIVNGKVTIQSGKVIFDKIRVR